MKFLCIYMMIYIRKVVGYPVAVDKEASRGRQGEKGKRASIQVTSREMRGMMMGTRTSLEVEPEEKAVTKEVKEEEAEADCCEQGQGLCYYNFLASVNEEMICVSEKEKEKINEAKYCERKNLSAEDRKPSFSDMQVGSFLSWIK